MELRLQQRHPREIKKLNVNFAPFCKENECFLTPDTLDLVLSERSFADMEESSLELWRQAWSAET